LTTLIARLVFLETSSTHRRKEFTSAPIDCQRLTSASNRKTPAVWPTYLNQRIESQFEVEAPPKELVAATRQAITDATDFNEREINYNFSYDYEAYSTVQRNVGRLIELGHLREAMELSLELMSQGSYQVEMRVERELIECRCV